MAGFLHDETNCYDAILGTQYLIQVALANARKHERIKYCVPGIKTDISPGVARAAADDINA